MKALRILIEEIDDEERAKPLHLDLQMVRVAGREKLQIRGMLLRAIEKFSDAPAKEQLRPRD